MKKKTVLIIGNTDGIGKRATERFLESDYDVYGVSRRELELNHENYHHFVLDVTDDNYNGKLRDILSSIAKLDVCVHCAGVGNILDLKRLDLQTKVFQVNVMGAINTTEVVLEKMILQNQGHFIGLSSLADCIVAPEAPSYSGSKAAVSNYWEGLGLALKKHSVYVSNIRFGFVDTKMAQSPIKPFLLSTDEACDFIFSVIKKPKIRATKPSRLLPMVWLLALINRFKTLI